ncbi:MAG: transposase [Dehalococcoidia bacterium]|nr:transposase [Dehalococcoidia bacterium]
MTGRKRQRERRQFSDAYKAEVVNLCRNSGKSIGQVAQELDLTDSAVRRWVAQAEVDEGQREGLTSDEQRELAELRRQNRELREERDILRRATAFFAKETR